MTATANTKKTIDPDLVPMDPGVEMWKNAMPGIVALNRLGDYGKTRTELIKGHRTFHITPQERRLNQNVCATKELDMFTNGTLQPVFLLDDEPDTPMLRQNPNVMDDKDIAKIFKLRGEAFGERIAEITNLVSLERLAELARDPRLNATIQQYEQIKARQRSIAPSPESAATVADANAERKPRAVTPK